MTTPAALHSKGTKRWGSPEDIVERGRRVMGAIDLDPCSEPKFQEVVRAERYYDLLNRGEDGLVLPWSGRVWCNPPGQLVREFWQKALSESCDQMIWVGFSVEQLCVLADEEAYPMDFSICIVRKRIAFTRHDGYRGSPSHGNYLAGVGVDPAAFEREFAPLGRIHHGRFSLTREHS